MNNEKTYISAKLLSEKIDEVFQEMPSDENQSMISFAHNLNRLNSKEADIPIQNSLQLLSQICYLQLNNKSKNDPFSLFSITSNLTDKEIKYLSEIINEIRQPILKARIGDILWAYCLPRNISHAYIAIENYLATNANQTFQPDIYDYWHRGIFLAKLTKNKNFIKQAKDKLFSELENSLTDWSFHQLRIAEIYVETELDKPFYNQLADILFEKQKDFILPDFFNEKEQYLKFLVNLSKK